jgi:hypothetical protein
MPHILPQLAQHGRRSSTKKLGYSANRLAALDPGKDLFPLAD